MKTVKKGLGLMLAGVMLAGILSGCGSAEEKGSGNKPNETADKVSKEGFPVVKEPMTLTMMGPDVGIQNWDKMPLFEEMEKLTGIHMEFQNAPKDAFETKKSLVLVSGTYPDIFYAAGLTPAEQVNYGGQGILVPLEDLIEGYAPNIKKLLDENPDIRKSITAPDGHIYALPVIEFNQPWYRNPLWYNGDFLEALGMDKLPETTEELYTYLKRVKEEDPNKNGKADEIPLSSASPGNSLRDIRTWLLGAFGIYEEEIYVDDSDKVHYTPMEEGYKEYLTYLNRLWNEDLLDHESFSQTAEQREAKARNNQVGLFSAWTAFQMMGEEPNTSDPMFSPVVSESVDKPAIAKNKGINTGAFAISNTNPSPEASMRWIDYSYSVEGATMFSKGPEGILWQYTDKENYVKEYLPVPDGGDREEYRSKITPNYGIPAPTINLPEISKGLMGDVDAWIENETKTKLLDRGARIPFPVLFLTPEEQAEVTTMTSDLNTYVRQMEAKFVTGAEPIANWDKYIGTIKKMGGERMAEIYQAAYDRWKAN
ncbi:putative aldouronate transport system substrate-binding protein [Paenibacillus castaneae]|uniref:extracellular solute-binding protein n=1 Tax=Paenibacillus castaneae TaxID=474957 RepID=UPI000C9AD8AC|nr:extracellular solute-binding protein [Paenibacillus castaneae]NIK78055.1 putative aldouronate transport system substrate-binding protein [Paenibacillus castaneae]